MSKVITHEVAAGRLTLAVAKAQLKTNAELVTNQQINSRLDLYKRRKVYAWDSEEEKKAILSSGLE